MFTFWQRRSAGHPSRKTLAQRRRAAHRQRDGLRRLTCEALEDRRILTASFVDLGALGLSPGYNSSLAWGDYNNDGSLDVLVSGRVYPSAPFSKIYQNNGNGTFTDIGAGLTGTYGGASAWADYDNDGRLDVLVTGEIDDWANFATKLYHNAGGGVFQEVATPFLAPVMGATAAWGDYDNDGRPDLLMTGMYPLNTSVTKLYHNDGGGQFTEISTGLTGITGGGVWGDYNGDGRLDVLLSGQSALNTYTTVIGRNNGDGTFTEISPAITGITLRRPNPNGLAWGDYDNDGRLDILAAGESTIADVTSVYHNNGDGTFTDINAVLPALRSGISFVAWGDYNNDGWSDILLAGEENWPSTASVTYVLANDHSGHFPDIGAGLAGICQGDAAWADYNNDGLLDFTITGYSTNQSATLLKFYRNATAVVNTAPAAPTTLTVSALAPTTATLSWAAPSDGQTPTAGLSYNLRVGTTPGGSDVVNPLADPSTGFRRLAQPGLIQGTSWTLQELTPTRTYYWSVQAVDTGLAGSAFATEGTFQVPEAPSLTVTTKDDVVNAYDGLASLREAMAYANSHAGADTITFGDGSASGGTSFLDAAPDTIVLGGTALPTITDAVTITGTGAALLTIDANHLSRIFHLDDGNSSNQVAVELVAMTLTGGNATGAVPANYGGAIFSKESLTLSDSVVTGNTAARAGGGIKSQTYSGGTTTIQNSTLSGNSAGYGGGIHSLNHGTTTIQNSTLSGNTASVVGGLWSQTFSSGTTTIQNSTLSGNTANYSAGGAYWNNSGTTTIQNSTVSGNSASAHGGGLLFVDYGTTTIENCTVSGNSAGVDGGGIKSISFGTTTIRNSTLSGNSAGHFGGGIFSRNFGTTDVLTSSLVAGNTATAFAPDLDNDQGTLTVTFSLIGDNTGTGWSESQTPDANGNLVGQPAGSGGSGIIDPRLGPLADNGGPTETRALLAHSPALNRGANPGSLTTDQRGGAFDRVVGGRPDMGALEQHPSVQDLANQAIDEDHSLDTSFHVGDVHLTAGIDTITVTSSNTALVPNANINLGGSGTNSLSNSTNSTPTLVITPAADQFGTTTITITVTDIVAGTPLTMTDTFVLTVTPMADLPSVTNASTLANLQTTAGLVLSHNAADGVEVTHFKITSITDGTLFQNNGTTPINPGDFITFAQGHAGLKFTSATNFVGTGHFTVQASLSNADAGLGGSPVTADITVTNAPPVLSTNVPLSVAEGSLGTVDTAHLQVTDLNHTPAQLVYTLAAVPALGTLSKSSTPLAVGHTFTQADMNGGLITYTADDGPAADSFQFTVSDGIDTLPLSTFSLTITNVAPTSLITGSGTGTVGTPITWTGGATDPSATDVAGGLQWLEELAGDVNHDGRQDMIGRTTDGQWWVAKSTGTGFVNEYWDAWPPIAWLDVQVADVDNDGRDDVVGRTEGGQWWVAQSDGTRFVTSPWGDWPVGTWHDVRVGDVDHDGDDDLVGRNDAGDWWVAQSTGTQFVSAKWGNWSPIPWLDVNFQDVTGDGRADVVGRTTFGQWWVGKANAAGTAFETAYWGYWSPVTWLDVQLQDLTGDGKADLLGRTDFGQWWVAVANADGTGSDSTYWGNWSPELPWHDVQVGDVNGDGRLDVVGRAGSGLGQWWAGRNTGAGFTSEFWGYWSPEVLWLGVQLADVTGPDASVKRDLVGRASIGSWWVGKSTGTDFGNEGWGYWSSGLSYAWTITRDRSLNDPSPIPCGTGTGSSFTFTPAEAGTYHVTLVAADKDGVGTSVTRHIAVGSALLAAGSVGQAFQPDTVSPERLTYPALALVVEQAIGVWQAAGLDAARVAALGQVAVAVADLPGAQLGWATASAIVLDMNAAGAGWYTGPGTGLSTLDARRSYDLLTAVMHEFGHVLGLEDRSGAGNDSDVMWDLLEPGCRRLPTRADVDAVFAANGR